ncbi:MAG: putative quinol monooxygenase [Siphonobacter sp.]
MKIYVTSIIKSKPEFLEEVKIGLGELVEQTRKEKACILYDLHQDLNDENTFVFYEIWENQQGLNNHNEQPYIKAFGNLADEKLQEKAIILLTHKIA